MLPQSHIAYTIAAFQLAGKRIPALRNADYRLVALAAVWQKAGSEQEDIRWAYWYAFTRRPELWGWEVGGLVAGLWFVLANRLYDIRRLVAFLRTGRLS